MLKYILPIVTICFALSCTTEPEVKPTPIVEDSSEIVDDKSKKEYDQSSVIARSEEFFDWYFDNSRMLYRMRSSCIGAENGFHALDKNKLKEYTDWLTETKFFSQAFIDFEYKRWTTECAEKMREFARKKKQIVGPPPCLFEGDIFLLMQEQPTPEMRDALEFSVAEQTDSSAVVNYDDRSALTWSYLDETWKIDTWPN
ncbi:MAG: hypothetical protein HRT58_07670 [Crocinitomicaceae bacterium]|nr:hypothetical protein [Flavobacteriales bacterium]NQZ35528.1 hypothetical protein [Crocinitomicaceae bacterium]